MKISNYSIFLLITIFAFSIKALAASGSLSVSSTKVYVGDTFKVTASVKGVAAWNVHVTASGPVSNCVINEANVTDDAKDTNKSFSVNCKATGTGTITLVLSGDVTSAAEGKAINISGSKTVNVTTKPITSDNNNIKSISIDGYDLVKVNDNNYTLLVSSDVQSLNVKVEAADVKSKVTGNGSHSLKVGENNIEVIITSESGLQNKINIKVTKKDGYYLEDLDKVLNDDKISDKNIILKSDTTITTNDLEKIKTSNKIVYFNYYDENKILLYSWIIDGSKLDKLNDLLTKVTFDSNNKKDILRLSNYADGLFITLNEQNNITSGIKLKVFLNNKYENNDLVNIYSYIKEQNKLELASNKSQVNNNYIEFEPNNKELFLTMSTIIEPKTEIVENKTKTTPISLIIALGTNIIVIVGIIIYFIKRKIEEKKYND